MGWLQVKENTLLTQEGLLCNKKNCDAVRGSPKCLHMNTREPLIYYKPIVGEPCEHGDGCRSISGPALRQLWGKHIGCRGHLDVCLPGRVPVNRPASQPSTPLGFGPYGCCLQSHKPGSTSLVQRCNDEALITTNEHMRDKYKCVIGTQKLFSYTWVTLEKRKRLLQPRCPIMKNSRAVFISQIVKRTHSFIESYQAKISVIYFCVVFECHFA